MPPAYLSPAKSAGQANACGTSRAATKQFHLLEQCRHTVRTGLLHAAAQSRWGNQSASSAQQTAACEQYVMSSPWYLEAVDSKTAASLLVAALQIADDAVMHILLLLAQEVSRDGVQGVAAQLVVSLDGLQQVKLDAAINGDLFVIVCAISFAAELGISHAELAAADDQLCCLEMLIMHIQAYVLQAAMYKACSPSALQMQC